MAYALGFDTSNYTTSVALYDPQKDIVIQRKKLLPVKDGELGLRQSDAVFSHVKQLGELTESLFAELPGAVISVVGASVRPRDADGSYMPCFLVGETAARAVAASHGIALSQVSHQSGHIAAALFSAGKLELIGREFAAFHLSGGTTECLLVHPAPDRAFSVELLGTSLDLKAGQAVDRVGGMLGLPFPAGAKLSELAARSTQKYSVKLAFKGFDCSLSGVENKCRAMCERGEPPEDTARYCIDSILAAVEQMTRLVRGNYPGLPIVYSGGVMSSEIIREEITEKYGGYFARPEFSSDNAAGVAILAQLAQMGGKSA